MKTFIEVDSVMPGDHIFRSEIGSPDYVKFHFEEGKTYLIKAKANAFIDKRVLSVMNKEAIYDAKISQKFFKEKFNEYNLKAEDFSYTPISSNDN